MDGRNKTKTELLEELTELRRRLGVLEDAEIGRRRSEEQARQDFGFFQATLDRLPVAVFVKDARPESFGRFVFWNTICEKLFGIKKEQSLGRTVFDLYSRDQAAFCEEQDHKAVAQGTLVDVPEEWIDSISLGRRLLHTMKSPILDESGQPRYLLCIAEDVTERKRSEEALRRLAGRLLTAQEAEGAGLPGKCTTISRSGLPCWPLMPPGWRKSAFLRRRFRAGCGI